MEMERWEPLGGGAGVWMSAEHRFGEDALLLARFSLPPAPPPASPVSPAPPASSSSFSSPSSPASPALSSPRKAAGERPAAAPSPVRLAADLGTGCGILPVLWCRDNPCLRVEALEIQPEAAELARRSAADSGFSDRIRVHTADLRRWREWLEPASMDLVAVNPPYFPPQSGGVPAEEAVRIARHENTDPARPGCSLRDAAAAAAGLLRSGGRFCLCHRPERLTDALTILREAGLEPKRLRFVHRNPGDAPWLFLCEGRRGGRPGLTLEPPSIQVPCCFGNI